MSDEIVGLSDSESERLAECIDSVLSTLAGCKSVTTVDECAKTILLRTINMLSAFNLEEVSVSQLLEIATRFGRNLCAEDFLTVAGSFSGAFNVGEGAISVHDKFIIKDNFAELFKAESMVPMSFNLVRCIDSVLSGCRQDNIVPQQELS